MVGVLLNPLKTRKGTLFNPRLLRSLALETPKYDVLRLKEPFQEHPLLETPACYVILLKEPAKSPPLIMDPKCYVILCKEPPEEHALDTPKYCIIPCKGTPPPPKKKKGGV